MIYQQCKDSFGNIVNCVHRLSDSAFIPFAPDNTDYQKFKAEINDESAQLETAEGVLISAEEAKAYVATLP